MQERNAQRDGLRLEGSVAVVTGGSRGIGLAVGLSLLGAGATVAFADVVEPDRWQDTASVLIDRFPERVSIHRVDVRDMDSCRSLVTDVTTRHGGIDILVNNAGVNVRSELSATSEEDWARVIDVNLNGTYRMCHSAHPALRASHRPSVVSIASTAGHVGIPGTAAYGTSKAGIIHITKVLAVEWSRDRIRVNAVAPTIVPTSMTEDITLDAGSLRRKLASIPLGRMVEPNEVADAVVFLASSAAVSITGHTLFVDGGFTAS